MSKNTLFNRQLRKLRKGSSVLVDIFLRNKFGSVGGVVLGIFILIAIFAPWLSPQDPTSPGYQMMKGPTLNHLMGTDHMGRDLLSRLMYGTKTSMIVGVTAAGVAMLIGTFVGIVSGYFGGAVGELFMRITDMFLVMPYIPLMIILASIFGRSLFNIIFVIGITQWSWTARIVRSETLSLKERPFIERARAIGSSASHIMSTQVLPNVVPLVIANAILTVSGAIISEATLSFIGLGDPTLISWGGILSSAFDNNAVVTGAWWFVIPPGVSIVLLALSFAFIGHAVDEVFNPKLRERS